MILWNLANIGASVISAFGACYPQTDLPLKPDFEYIPIPVEFGRDISLCHYRLYITRDREKCTRMGIKIDF